MKLPGFLEEMGNSFIFISTLRLADGIIEK
jgi:hypothetical protein